MSKFLLQYGPLFIILCMLLRATDVVFRSITLTAISPLEMITLEHFIASIVLSIFFLPFFSSFFTQHTSLKELFQGLKSLNAYELFCVLFISCGASVGGILCFTSAFQYINPSIVILLQKLQPIVSISLSYLLLKERLPPKFWLWSVVAIGSGYILGFGFSCPDFSLSSANFKGILYALLAMSLWGSGTVFGKKLVNKLHPGVVTRLRYFLGFSFAFIILLGTRFPFSSSTAAPSATPFAIVSHVELIPNIAYMALIPGLSALILFYYGLQKTSASISSILELAFPLFSVALAWLILGKPLNFQQLIAGTVLLFAVIMISQLKSKESTKES